MHKLAVFALIVAIAAILGGWTWDDSAHAASWNSKAPTSQNAG